MKDFRGHYIKPTDHLVSLTSKLRVQVLEVHEDYIMTNAASLGRFTIGPIMIRFTQWVIDHD